MRTLPYVWRKGCTVALIFLTLGLALTCGVTSARWVDTPFPGFFVLANRVVASVSLLHWSVASQSHIYQHAIVAVNRQPIHASEDIYAAVRRQPLASPVIYALENDGQRSQVSLFAQTFAVKDYLLLFGAYLLNGLALAAIGIGVWFLKPGVPASHALLTVGLAGGGWALTAADLYSPYWFFRLHVLGEALFPAGFVHLALVFPVNRLHSPSPLFLWSPYVVAFILAAAYETSLYQPASYSFIHNLCNIYAGLGLLILLGKIIWDYTTTESHLVRQRIRVIRLGFLCGFAFPAGLTLLSGVTGGGVPVNYAAFTAFLFPLSLGYAIVKHDLFEIDAMLKRGMYYLTLTAILTVAYFALLAGLNLTLHSSEFARAPFFPLVFTLAAVFLLNPLKDHLQKVVDRVFFRLRYDPKKVLEVTSTFLASTLQLEEILSCIWQTIGETVGVTRGAIFLLTADKQQYRAVYQRTDKNLSLPVDHLLIQGIQQRGQIFSRSDLDDGILSADLRKEIRGEMDHLGAQLLVPLSLKDDLVGLIVLGNRESGASFSADDLKFLHTLANQSTLSIANALSYQEIQELNTELHSSFARSEQAYQDLQRSQDNLVRSEKMADLGRLTAGIAHEMNTPLGASLSSFKVLQGLIEEYRRSVGDPEVNAQDHHEIAAEMDKLVSTTQQWLEKATSYIRSLKLQTRDLKQGEESSFSILQTIEDTRLLLSHRLRVAHCTVAVSCATAEPLLHGDPSKMVQVLTNLIGNAMDAYKDTGKDGGEIVVTVSEDVEFLELRVSDQGCGIAPENLERIFDELFTTKPLGEGTGLGLTISRDIVNRFFKGTMRVASTLGHGTTFILRLPRYRGETEPPHTGQAPIADHVAQAA